MIPRSSRRDDSSGVLIVLIGATFVLLLLAGGAAFVFHAQHRRTAEAEAARAAAEAAAEGARTHPVRPEAPAQVEPEVQPQPVAVSEDDARRPLVAPKRLDAPEAVAAVVPWQEAGDYRNQKVAVEGRIVATHNSGRACFLNFDADWRGKFHCVIFASAFPDFPDPPETYYRGKRVRVTGKVKEHQGAPQIVVERPSQIEVLPD